MKSHKTAYVGLMPKNERLGLSPKTGWELTVPPISPLVGWGVGKPIAQLPLNAFGVSLRRLPRLKSNVPLPKQFSGSAPVIMNILCVSSSINCAVPGYAHASFSPKFLMGFYWRGIYAL